MRGILYEGGPNAGWVFLVLTLVMGGAAALATGRALARTWRSQAQLPFPMLLLAAAVCFLHYALFFEPTIPIGRFAGGFRMLADRPGAAVSEMAASLHYLAVTFVLMTGFGLAGFRLTRARQMETRYPWAMRRRGLFGWTVREVAERPD
jgi:hypothetical protein